jgi:hypothetical protein
MDDHPKVSETGRGRALKPRKKIFLEYLCSSAFFPRPISKPIGKEYFVSVSAFFRVLPRPIPKASVGWNNG